MEKVPSPSRILAPLKKEVLRLGFTRHGDCFLRPLAPGVFGYLSFWTADVRAPEFAIGCLAGVHHEGILAVKREMTGKHPDVIQPVVSLPVRKCVPGEPLVGYGAAGQVWRVPHVLSPPGFLEQFRSELVEHGLPFIERHASESAILQTLATRHSRYNGSLYFFLPATLLYLGRASEAVAYMRDFLAKSTNRPGEQFYEVYSSICDRIAFEHGVG